MDYGYGFSELADKEHLESQKGRRDFSSVFSASVVQTLENEIPLEGSVYFVLYDKFNAYIYSRR